MSAIFAKKKGSSSGQVAANLAEVITAIVRGADRLLTKDEGTTDYGQHCQVVGVAQKNMTYKGAATSGAAIEIYDHAGGKSHRVVDPRDCSIKIK